MIEPVAAQLREQIGAGYFGDDDLTIGGAILGELGRRGQTLAVAESVTGGGIADEIVTCRVRRARSGAGSSRTTTRSSAICSVCARTRWRGSGR